MAGLNYLPSINFCKRLQFRACGWGGHSCAQHLILTLLVQAKDLQKKDQILVRRTRVSAHTRNFAIIARIGLPHELTSWICMNIREVAKRAKVSTATVSRTINDSEKVKPGTAERVRKAIEELNFYPNTHARTLVSGRSRMLGLIISDITNPFYPELVKSFEDQAVERGQEVIIGNTDYNTKRMAGCIRRMVERKVDGVAIMTSEADPGLITELTRRNIPTVFMD